VLVAGTRGRLRRGRSSSDSTRSGPSLLSQRGCARDVVGCARTTGRHSLASEGLLALRAARWRERVARWRERVDRRAIRRAPGDLAASCLQLRTDRSCSVRGRAALAARRSSSDSTRSGPSLLRSEGVLVTVVGCACTTGRHSLASEASSPCAPRVGESACGLESIWVDSSDEESPEGFDWRVVRDNGYLSQATDLSVATSGAASALLSLDQAGLHGSLGLESGRARRGHPSLPAAEEFSTAIWLIAVSLLR